MASAARIADRHLRTSIDRRVYTECPSNTFSGVSGSAACTPCPAGTAVSATGSTSAFACQGPLLDRSSCQRPCSRPTHILASSESRLLDACSMLAGLVQQRHWKQLRGYTISHPSLRSASHSKS